MDFWIGWTYGFHGFLDFKDFLISLNLIGNLEQFVSRAYSQENDNIRDIENIHNCSVESLAPKVLKDISFLFLFKCYISNYRWKSFL